MTLDSNSAGARAAKISRVGAAQIPYATASDRRALWAFLAFTAVALIGYGAFGLHPELMPPNAQLWAFYQISFPFFGRAHVALSAIVLGFVLARRVGPQFVPALIAVYLVSFLAELVGTGYGLPFGEYSYTGLLGYKLGGRVPALIPLSWFIMALPCYGVAKAAFPSRRPTRLLFAAAMLTAWDLALDPAMSFLTPYWSWGEVGSYYGMPWINLVGWMGTGLALMMLLEWLGRGWTARLPVGWLAAFYLVVLAMPLGMAALAGLWGAVAVTTLSVAAIGLATHVLEDQARLDRGSVFSRRLGTAPTSGRPTGPYEVPPGPLHRKGRS